MTRNDKKTSTKPTFLMRHFYDFFHTVSTCLSVSTVSIFYCHLQDGFAKKVTKHTCAVAES